MNCPRLRHSRSDSSGKQELVSARNVPDEENDENCLEADNEKVPQMPLKFNWRQTENLEQIFSDQRRTRRESGDPVREFSLQPICKE